MSLLTRIVPAALGGGLLLVVGCAEDAAPNLRCGPGTHAVAGVCLSDNLPGDPSGGGDPGTPGDPTPSGDPVTPGETNSPGDPAFGDEPGPGDLGFATSGSFSLLTYNVAGLPQGISGSDPATNVPLISPKLNAFDLALVQEDFAYHDQLAAAAQHPYQSESNVQPGVHFGDGLNRFSQFPISAFQREAWQQCHGVFDHGSDCWTPKGFSVGLHALANGVEIDIYNLHHDASSSAADIAARDAQVAQLLGTILSRSAGRAMIVAGDTNMDDEDELTLQALLTGAGLADACRALSCGEIYRIDRVMFRSSTTVLLTPTSWLVDTSFVNGSGDPLSDHEAVAVNFDWAVQ